MFPYQYTGYVSVHNDGLTKFVEAFSTGMGDFSNLDHFAFHHQTSVLNKMNEKIK